MSSRTTTWPRPIPALGLLLSLFMLAPPASAESADDKAAAEALFDEGKSLFLAKRFAEACPKLEASQKLDPGIGTLLYLADCYEGLGRVASAWATFREAAGAAKNAGQAERERVARARAAALEPKLHRLTLNVGAADTPGLKILRNNTELKREVWGAALPIDPGKHEISAAAPGKKGWSTSVEIAAGPGTDTVAIPALEDAPASPPPPPPPPPVKAPDPPPPPPPPAPFFNPQRVAGLAVGSAGVIGLGLGGLFAGLAASANGSAKEICVRVICTDRSGVDAANRAGTFADASTGLFIAGGVVAATGLIVFLTASSSKPSPPAADRAFLTPLVSGSLLGLSAGRTW